MSPTILTDKIEATRLADALRNWNKHQPSPLLHEADSLLRRWPDAGEPVAYQYLFDGYNGPVWRSDSGPWNGMQPKASRPLYAAPPDQSERIAALEAALAEHDRVIEQARGAMERSLSWLTSYPGDGTLSPGGPYQQMRAALRAIEELKR